MQVTNKTVAIVTGASEGIGRAIATQLSERGATVVVAARNKEKLDELARELGDNVLPVQTDMRTQSDIKHLVDTTVKKFGRVDLLVNNAGQGMYGPVETADVEQYESIVLLNVVGPLRAMQEVIPVMRKQGGGLILNVSSMVSKNYYPNLGTYASTKYALNALSLTARQELAKDNIIVSVLHPRMTATAFGENAIRQEPAGIREQAVQTGSMPVDTAEDVATVAMEQIESEAPEAMLQ